MAWCVLPIYPNSLFTFKDWDAIDTAFSNADQEFIYTRGNNPSVKVVEEKLAKMGGGERAKLFTSGKEIEAFKKAIQDNTCLIYLESPSSVVFSLQDLEAVGKLAREHAWLGGKVAPFEAWLIMRSLRTLHLRMKAHQERAMKVAKFLEGHSKVKHVYYPGLESYDQYELGKKQMSGYSGLLAIELVCTKLEKIKAFVNHLEIFSIGVSWGGLEIAVVDSPKGLFRGYLNKPLIDCFINGAQPIDAHLFKDDDNKVYLYYGRWGHCNIARMNEEMRFVDGQIMPVMMTC